MTHHAIPAPFADQPVNAVLSAYAALEYNRRVQVNALSYSAAIAAKIQTHDPNNQYKLSDFLPYGDLSQETLAIAPTTRQVIDRMVAEAKIPIKLYVELQKLCLIRGEGA